MNKKSYRGRGENKERPLYFMMAQLPFNREELVGLNEPRAALMDDEANLRITRRNLEELRVRAEILAEHTAFLEIGCGRGYVLADLYKQGNGLYLGLEPIPTQFKIAKQTLAQLKRDVKTTSSLVARFKAAAKFVKQRGPLPVWNTTLEKFNVKKGTLTHIYSYHVIEHLENPLLMIEKAYEWLMPGGKLMITCPNVGGAMASKNFATWRCNIRAHRWLPDVTSLVRMIEAEGFLLRKVFTYGGYPRPRSLVKSVANMYYKWQNKGDVLCLMAEKL
ncbi:methyltransferase [Spirochaetota bacterium]|nr:methyltransferase [Spirochaetota bacterium]